MRQFACCVVLIALLAASAAAADLSGTWNFSVDLDNGGHGDPVFVLKQAGEKLTGTYNGPLGERPVTGSVKGATATLQITAEQGGQTMKLTYSGKIEGADKLSGTVKITTDAGDGGGKFTATRKK